MQTYKHKPIHFYDPHKAPLLDHYRYAACLRHELEFICYRLKVPAIRSVLDYFK